MLSSRTAALTGQVILRITEALGLRLLTLNELKKIFDKPLPTNPGPVSRSLNGTGRQLNRFGETEEETWGARTERVLLAISS